MRKGWRNRATCVSMALVACFGLLATAEDAATIEVRPGESIQAAIDAASDGAMVVLFPGVYRENLRIDRAIQIAGDPTRPEDVIVEARVAGPAMMLTDTDAEHRIVLEGFTIRGAFGYLPDGILHAGTAELDCLSLIVADCQGNGISVQGPAVVRIEACRILGNSRFGIEVHGGASVTGAENVLSGNGADLAGHAPPDLRTPQAPETTTESVRVPEDYPSIQAGIDAVAPGGIIHIGSGEFGSGITIWKAVELRGGGPDGVRLTGLVSILASAEIVTLTEISLQVEEKAPIAIHTSLVLDRVGVTGTGKVSRWPVFMVGEGGSLTADASSFSTIGGTAIEGIAGSSIRLSECSFDRNYIDLSTTAARHVLVEDCRFIGARGGSVVARGNHIEVSASVFEPELSGIEIFGGSGAIRDCVVRGGSRFGMDVSGESDVLIERTTLSGAGESNVRVSSDAKVRFSSCILSGANGCGLLAIGHAQVELAECTVHGNHNDGIVVSEFAYCEIVDSEIDANGLYGGDAEDLDESRGAGIRVGMKGHVVLRDTSVVQNLGHGIAINAGYETYDSLFDVGDPRDVIPVVEATGCHIDGNVGSGLRIGAAGRATLDGCTMSGNRESGVVLDGEVFGLTFDPRSSEFEFDCRDGDGVGAAVQNCTIEENGQAGIEAWHGAIASVTQCEIRGNGIGVSLDTGSRLGLLDSVVSSNASFGVLLVEGERSSDPVEVAEVISGSGNTIPGPEDEHGNAEGAFSVEGLEFLTEIRVSPGESIQAAIDAAPDGATIRLAPGEYVETLTIQTSVTLIGSEDPEDPTIIRPSPTKLMQPTVTVLGSADARLESLVIEGDKRFRTDTVAVYGSASAALQTLEIRGSRGNGISVYSIGATEIRGCSIHAIDEFAILVQTESATVFGGENDLRDNGADLGLYAPPELRIPLAIQTESMHVRVPDDYATIQEAIDAVAPGGTVEIDSGSFSESLTVWKSVTLLGQGDETKLGAAADVLYGGVVLHCAGSSVIERIRLDRSWMICGTEATIRDVTVACRDEVGIELRCSVNAQLEDVRVRDVRGAGVRLNESTTAFLTDCSFRGCRVGIAIDGSGHVDASSCTFEDCVQTGLSLDGRGTSAAVRASGFAGNMDGITSVGSLTVDHCAFDRQATRALNVYSGETEIRSCAIRGSGESAISVFRGTVRAQDSVIAETKGERAVFCEQTGQLEMVDCTIAENLGYAAYAQQDSRLEFVGCTITDNGLSFGSSGVFISDNATVRLEDCDVGRNAGSGIEMMPLSALSRIDPAIPEGASPESELEIVECRVFENAEDGLFVLDGKRINIRQSIFERNYGNGIHIDEFFEGTFALVESQIIDHVRSGVVVASGTEVLIERCTIGRSGMYGLIVAGSTVAAVRACLIVENLIGVGLAEAPSVELSDCEITGNLGYGLQIYGLECSGGRHLHQSELDFTGELTGSGNVIPDGSGLNGNGLGGICPAGEWDFLLEGAATGQGV